MPGRILNFSEFYSKYSKSKKELTLDNVVNSPSNFEDGFDDSTYDQEQIGPNRPIKQSGIPAPSNPGEGGIPKFNTKKEASMEAPEDDEEDDDDEEEFEADPEKSSANPKKEEPMKTNESSKIWSFSQFKRVNEYLDETGDTNEYGSDPYGEYGGSYEENPEEYGSNPFEEDFDEYGDPYEEDICQDCGDPYEGSMAASANPGMKTCGCNP
jgi:hypothetical protein